MQKQLSTYSFAISVCVCVYVCTCVYVCMYVCVYVCVCVCVSNQNQFTHRSSHIHINSNLTHSYQLQPHKLNIW